MEHDEIYDEICKPKLDSMEGKIDTILTVLKGDNGNPGICERLRNLEKSYKYMIGAGIFLLSIVAIQAVGLLFEWFKDK